MTTIGMAAHSLASVVRRIVGVAHGRRAVGLACALPVRALASALGVLVLVPAFAASASAQVVEWGGVGGVIHDKPTAVRGLEEASIIDASNSSSYALADGAVWAWGENAQAQLGIGSRTVDHGAPPVKVKIPADVTIVAIGEAENNGFAVDSTGDAWAWGEKEGGTMCMRSHAQSIETPVLIPTLSKVVAVQGGEHHTIWLLSNGTVETCGHNAQGQLGVSGIEESSAPVLVPGLSEVEEVSAGERSSCARTKSGAIYDWGADNNGQVGNGETREAVYEPYLVPLPGRATEVSCGGDVTGNGQTLALVNGEVYAWGADHAGQLGDGSRINKLSPVDTGLHFKEVVTSGATSYGLDSSGHVWSWGSAETGDLGTGSKKNSPVPVLVADENVVAISATAKNVAALSLP
ncbi:MAG TPA: hypothetical protein VKG82_07830 [Solirubrobacteraceae bacterium]|nr:hypothetical protein [Solirubrobacteraceae bacterium]